MKKKIINGILMVALLFAATTSFVSCKDNVDDEITAVYANLAKQKTTLEDQLNALQNQLNGLGDNSAEIAKINGEIAKINEQLGKINEQISSLSGNVDTIKNDLAALTDRVKALEDAIKNLGGNADFGVSNAMAINDIVGNMKLGLDFYSLAAFYGTNDTGLDIFPVAGKAFNVDTQDGTMLAAEELEGIETIELDPEFITAAKNNAGKLIFAINSSKDINISDYNVYLEDSKGNKAPVDLVARPYTAEDETISFGWTRADDAAAAGAAKNVFVAEATIDAANLKAAAYKLPIKFDEIKDRLKTAKQHVSDADGTKNEVKQGARELAQLVYNLYKNAAWDRLTAQRLVVEKDNAGGRSDFNIFAASVKPLSYNSFWEFEKNVSDPSLEDAEAAVEKLVQILKKEFPSLAKLSSINIDDMKAQKVTVVVDGKEKEVTIDKALFKSLRKAIEAGIDNEELTKMIKKIAGLTDLKKVKKAAVERIADYLNRFDKKIINQLRSHQLTRALSPIILFEGAEGVDRVVTGLQVPAGDMQVYLTSPTEEVLVPAYAKFIAVKNAATGKLEQSALLDGRALDYTLNLTSGRKVIILSCVDYYGYVVTKRYTVDVK